MRSIWPSRRPYDYWQKAGDTCGRSLANPDALTSRHFKEEDIDRTSLSSVRIRYGAVPSIFDAFPDHLKKNAAPERKPPRKRTFSEHRSESESEQPVSECLDNLTETECLKSENEVLKHKLASVENKLTASRKKRKVLYEAKRRLKKRNGDLKSVISELKKKCYISEDSLGVLEKCGGGVQDLLKRQIAKHGSGKIPNTYSPALRTFALTLHLYSPHAYRYVRKVFDTCLPHPRTVKSWYQSVDSEPGFTQPALSALKLRADMAAKEGKPTLCSLIMDEMALKQQVEWDGQKYHGYVDMGTGVDDDSLPIAKEALTFMVVSVNGTWKMPVGYFLIAGLGAAERANIVKQCLTVLHSTGITVISLTCDGASSNVAMINTLGCSFAFDTVESAFKHPVTEKPVCVLLDPCHMLKLVRNCFGDRKVLIDESGNLVKWDYIERLHELQEYEQLHLANKLRAAHIAWRRKKNEC